MGPSEEAVTIVPRLKTDDFASDGTTPREAQGFPPQGKDL
jgi:hypothetical protein